MSTRSAAWGSYFDPRALVVLPTAPGRARSGHEISERNPPTNHADKPYSQAATLQAYKAASHHCHATNFVAFSFFMNDRESLSHTRTMKN
jgi:hypothetical protein